MTASALCGHCEHALRQKLLALTAHGVVVTTYFVRLGITMQENRLVHTVLRLMVHSGTGHVQASRVKSEAENTRKQLQEGSDNRSEKTDSGLERMIHRVGPHR